MSGECTQGFSVQGYDQTQRDISLKVSNASGKPSARPSFEIPRTHPLKLLPAESIPEANAPLLIFTSRPPTYNYKI
jgi:hypothetical protein